MSYYFERRHDDKLPNVIFYVVCREGTTTLANQMMKVSKRDEALKLVNYLNGASVNTSEFAAISASILKWPPAEPLVPGAKPADDWP